MSSVYILDTCSQPPLSTRHSSRLVVVIVTGEAALESMETVEDTLETVETGVEVEMVEVEVEGQSSSSLPSLQSCWPSHRWTNQRRLLRSRDQPPPITAHLVPAQALAAVCAAELPDPAAHPQPRTHRVRLGRGNIRFQMASSNIVKTFTNSVDSSTDPTSSEPSGQSWSPSQSQAEWMQKCRSRH